METIKTANGIVIEYPAGCGNAPRKFFLVEAVAAVLEKDEMFLNEAVMEETQLPDIPAGIDKIVMHSIITHGKEAAMECILHFEDGTLRETRKYYPESGRVMVIINFFIVVIHCSGRCLVVNLD